MSALQIRPSCDRVAHTRIGKPPLTVLWNEPSASYAYAKAMNAATADIVVVAHCDITTTAAASASCGCASR